MFGLGKHRGQREEPDQVSRCSFCNKRKDQVRQLVAGPTVYICNECVQVCVDIIATGQELQGAEQGAETRPDVGPEQQARIEAQRMNSETIETGTDDLKLPLWHVRCGLCHLVVETDQAVPIEDRGILCGSCVRAVHAAYETESRESGHS
jgi:hypothetical protein